MKKIILLFSFLLIITGCSSKKESLVMVTEAGFAPYEYYENNKIVGVDVEIAKEIAQKLKRKLVIKDVAFDSIINELNAGKASFAAAGLSVTEERKEKVDFSVEYSTSKQVIVIRKDSLIKSSEDLENKKITCQLGTVADLYLSDHYKEENISRHKKFLSAAQDIKTKKADALIMDYFPAKELIKENKELKMLDKELFSDTYAIAVKKGNKELLKTINEVLDELLAANKIDEYVIKHTK
ncbi:MAG: ABC transporter substrate-binding protein [Bacilli bacterium]